MRDYIFKTIMSDLERLDKPCLKNFIKYYFFPRGTVFPYQVWFRILQHIKRNKFLKYIIGPFVYFIFRHYEFKYQIHINSNIHVGKGLLIVHGNIFLNCSYIGDNFTVFQYVTLGKKQGEGIPRVCNNVTIYANSVVVGNICLENNCTVGALSYCSKNVKEYDTVAGVPAKSLMKE